MSHLTNCYHHNLWPNCYNFQWQEDIVVATIALLSAKACLRFLIFYFLAKIFGETFNAKSNSFLRNSGKSCFSSEQNKLKEIWDTVFYMEDSWRQKYQNKKYLTPFCSSRLVHFFKFSFRENWSFENVSFS